MAATNPSWGQPRRFAIEDPIRRFIEVWSDPEASMEDLLGLLHPLAFDLHLPQGRARGREALGQIRLKVVTRPFHTQYRVQHVGPVRDTAPRGGYRVATQVIAYPGDQARVSGPIQIVFEFRRTLGGELRIARIEPAR